MSNFGDLLRLHRERSRDPDRPNRRLSQQRLGELLGQRIGHSGYSGAAVSDWERSNSKIDEDDRHVLVGLVQLLRECGGLQTAAEANDLLRAGNYRALDEEELRAAFPGAAITERAAPAMPRLGAGPRPAAEGGPHWTAHLLAALGAATAGISADTVWRALPWVGLWFFTWKWGFALCNWPFAGLEQVRSAVLTYVAVTLSVPPLVALAARFSTTGEGAPLAGQPLVRFYVHLGALVGFHVGFMLAFGLALVALYLEIGPLPPVAFAMLAVWPLLLSYAGARRIPINQWRAFGHLQPGLPEVMIAAGFGLFGVWWGAFFYEFHAWLLEPVAGFVLAVAAAALGTGLALWRRPRPPRGGTG